MVKKINFQNFVNRERRLDRVTRFSAHKRIKDQSVSEHSFHTAMYAMILADLEKKFYGKKLDVEKILRIALLHDLEECLTGDIIHTFKYTDKNLKTLIEKFGREYLEGLLKNLDEEISKDYLGFWMGSHDKNKIEGRIVEAADKLEGLFYAIDEYSLGNKEFKEIIGIYIKLLRKMRLKSVGLVLLGLKAYI
ncbi:MAG: YfbR-like 5'-deoxynucleotidase [Patescibacteria group bacterium]